MELLEGMIFSVQEKTEAALKRGKETLGRLGNSREAQEARAKRKLLFETLDALRPWDKNLHLQGIFCGNQDIRSTEQTKWTQYEGKEVYEDGVWGQGTRFIDLLAGALDPEGKVSTPYLTLYNEAAKKYASKKTYNKYLYARVANEKLGLSRKQVRKYPWLYEPVVLTYQVSTPDITHALFTTPGEPLMYYLDEAAFVENGRYASGRVKRLTPNCLEAIKQTFGLDVSTVHQKALQIQQNFHHST